MSEIERNVQRGAWTERLDHEVASANVFDTTFQNGDPVTNLRGIIHKQIAIDEQTYIELIGIGMHFIPLDSEENLTNDDTLHQAYSTGVTMAMATLDALCERLEIDIDMFRRAWRVNGLVTMLDKNHESTRGMTVAETNEAVARGVLASGHRMLDRLGEVYDPVIDSLGTLNQATAINPNVARGSFGYVLQGGLNALNKVLLELEARRLTDNLDYEQATDEWANQPLQGSEDTPATYDAIDHAAIADAIDTAAFYTGEKSRAESYIGRLILEHVDSDDEVCDTIAALAVARYPNEMNALDFVGEAFYHGGVIGLKVVQEHATASSLPKVELNEAWRSIPLHEQAENFGVLSAEEETALCESIERVITGEGVPAPYQRVLDKLAHDLGLDEEEASAFLDGFRYVYGSGRDVLCLQLDQSITEQVENAKITLDDELRELFGDL